MTKILPLTRPAASAIAVLVALSAPAAFAQDAPADAPPPPAAEPVAPPMTSPVAPAAAPVEAAQSPAPVIRVPLDIEPPAPEATAKPAEPAPVPAERRAGRVATADRTATTAATGTPSATPAETPAPAAAPPVAAEPIVDTAPAPAERTPAESSNTADDGFPWNIAGGAAILLLAGGAGLAFVRRRRGDEPAESVPAVPVETPAAIPAPSTAPRSGMGRHEAMAMAGPTPDNRFVTLKKRLKHARFRDRCERMEYAALMAGQKDMRRKPATAWEIAQRPLPAPAEQEVRRPEPARGTRTLRPGFGGG